MSTRRVIISAPYLQRALEQFRAEFEERGFELIVPTVRERLSEPELLPLVAGIDAIIAGDDEVTERVLDHADRLKVVVKWGTGIDSIDLDACARRGVAVRNTPGAFTDPVADTVLGYLLCFARALPESDRAVRGGRWQKLPGRSLGESTLGIIGVGNIGRAVARRAAAFGTGLLGTDPVDVPDTLCDATGLRQVPLEELLASSDFISLNCDLNPSSRHLINDETLGRIKVGAILVNTARGPVVDEPALVRALEDRRLAGAALDVFELEPLPDDSPLRAMDNVLLAPHNANASPRAWQRVHRSSIDQLVEVLR